MHRPVRVCLQTTWWAHLCVHRQVGPVLMHGVGSPACTIVLRLTLFAYDLPREARRRSLFHPPLIVFFRRWWPSPLWHGPSTRCLRLRVHTLQPCALGLSAHSCRRRLTSSARTAPGLPYSFRVRPRTANFGRRWGARARPSCKDLPDESRVLNRSTRIN